MLYWIDLRRVIYMGMYGNRFAYPAKKKWQSGRLPLMFLVHIYKISKPRNTVALRMIMIKCVMMLFYRLKANIFVVRVNRIGDFNFTKLFFEGFDILFEEF